MPETPSRATEPSLLAVIEGAESGLAGLSNRRRESPGLSGSGLGHDGRLALLGVLTLLVAVAALISTSHSASASGCRPLRYWFDPTSGPRGVEGDVDSAFDALSKATGVDVVRDPQVGVGRAGVLVAFTQAARLDGSHRVGFGSGSSGEFGGSVLLNRDASLPVGTSKRASWRGVVLHELGHVVGLDHSANPSDVMYPSIDVGPANWSPAELAQLTRVGRRLGCRDPRQTPD